MPTEEQRASNYRKFSRYYTTIKGRAAFLINNARKRAAKAGVACSLTQEWVEEKLKGGVCEVTGIPLELHVGGGKGSRNNSFSPSLDRILQTGEFSPDNIRLTCWIYNRAR